MVAAVLGWSCTRLIYPVLRTKYVPLNGFILPWAVSQHSSDCFRIVSLSLSPCTTRLHSGGTQLPLYALAACAVVAAALSTSVTQPFDVLRAHRQVLLSSVPSRRSPAGDPAIPLSWWRVFRSVYRTDGVGGLWRGMLFRLFRRSGVGVISWSLYERFS